MEQVYITVGFVIVWGCMAIVVGMIAILIGAYIRGLYWAVSYTLWAARNSNKRNKITQMMIVKNIFMEWNGMAMASKGTLSATAPNGAHWSN